MTKKPLTPRMQLALDTANKIREGFDTQADRMIAMEDIMVLFFVASCNSPAEARVFMDTITERAIIRINDGNPKHFGAFVTRS